MLITLHRKKKKDKSAKDLKALEQDAEASKLASIRKDNDNAEGSSGRSPPVDDGKTEAERRFEEVQRRRVRGVTAFLSRAVLIMNGVFPAGKACPEACVAHSQGSCPSIQQQVGSPQVPSPHLFCGNSINHSLLPFKLSTSYLLACHRHPASSSVLNLTNAYDRAANTTICPRSAAASPYIAPQRRSQVYSQVGPG